VIVILAVIDASPSSDLADRRPLLRIPFGCVVFVRAYRVYLVDIIFQLFNLVCAPRGAVGILVVPRASATRGDCLARWAARIAKISTFSTTTSTPFNS
jgi:hypothetical protein